MHGKRCPFDEPMKPGSHGIRVMINDLVENATAIGTWRATVKRSKRRMIESCAMDDVDACSFWKETFESDSAMLEGYIKDTTKLRDMLLRSCTDQHDTGGSITTV